jgi:hypothetical protein
MDEKQTEKSASQPSESEDYGRSRGFGRIWTGLFLLLIGGVLLLDQMGFPFPDWFFSWHLLLIVIGLFIGFRHNFRGGGWLALILVGAYFMAQDNYPRVPIHRYIGPVALIAVALIVLLRPQRRRHRYDNWTDNCWNSREPRNNPGVNPQPGPGPGGNPQNAPGGDPRFDQQRTDFDQKSARPDEKSSWSDKKDSFREHFFRDAMRPHWNKHEWKRQMRREWKEKWHQGFDRDHYSSDDFLDATNIFGGTHRKVVTKNFKGGEVTTFMGGTEINLSQADINGTVVLDVTQVMGGTKIIVPAHWEIRPQITAFFAGFEDKRQQPVAVNSDKVLILKGASVFGGIELRNF